MKGNPGKRESILQSAEKIMAKNGSKATISEIARSAGVFESTIYKYFKNKEDLLFSVAQEQTQKWMQSLHGQLEDTPDPVQKLRKFIGWQLHRFDVESDYSEIILFQCRSRRNFYFHKAFAQLSDLRAVFGRIIDEGARQGVFRADLSKPALWHIVAGLTDMSYLIPHDGEGHRNIYGDLDAIMDLMLPMVAFKRKKVNRRQEKTGKIIKAAERIFAEKGFEHTRIQEIAKSAGVADGSIYDYFSNKDHLLFAILQDGFTDSPYKKDFKGHLYADHDIPATPLEKAKRFIRHLLFIAVIQPDFAKVMVLHGIYNREFYQSKAFDALTSYLAELDTILDDGKQQGQFRRSVENRVFKNLVLGIFSMNSLRWFLQEDGHRRDKVKEIDTLITYMDRSVLNRKEG